MVNQEWFRDICDDIYQATGIKAVLYNADMQVIYAHPMSMNRFCSMIRQNPALTEKCLHCDRVGLAQCQKNQDIFIYQCHMGLTEAIAPILEDGNVIGYLLFGQLLSDGHQAAVCQIIDENPEIADKPALKKELEKLEVIHDTKLRAAARLMGMCACYVRLHQVIRMHQESMILAIKEYIKQNLDDPELGIEMICRRFDFSRGKLYQIARQAHSMGITEYIRALRLKRAEEYLRTTPWPLYQIAERVGISDSDYLTKLLKKAYGKTPRQIRSENTYGE